MASGSHSGGLHLVMLRLPEARTHGVGQRRHLAIRRSDCYLLRTWKSGFPAWKEQTQMQPEEAW